MFGAVHDRLLYFFMEKKMVVTHGFVKRTERIPEAEIEKALSAMKDLCQRIEKGDISI